MCDVCRCELPINRSGHVTRECRRIHRAGSKHQAALTRQQREREEFYERFQAHQAEQARQQRAARVHALTLGLLITRLRAKHGSMAHARGAWAQEAVARLTVLDAPELQQQLLGPATQALALTEMREMLHTQDHELLRMLMANLGWDD